MAMKPIRRVYPERPRRRPKVVRRTLPPVPAPEPPLAACPAAAEPWEGLQVKIEDLPAFRARWGLVSVRGKWPDDEPCPRLDLREGRNH